MNLKNLPFAIFIFVFFVAGCQAKNVSVIPTETNMPLPSSVPSETPIPIVSTTPSPIPSPISTAVPTQTSTPSCMDIDISAPMTESQVKYIKGHPYNFLYATDERNIDSVYSVNRADTVCSQGYPSGNFNVWKVVSGFIVEMKQPNKDLYNPGGEDFVNVYVKARFISQDGTQHDYWLQLTGNPPSFWFQLVQWDKLISESENNSGLTAMDILLTEKNGDGTSSYINANTIVPDGLLKANDQFVAIIFVGTTNSNSGFSANSEILQQFVDAVEGKADFPIAPEGFFLPVQAIIVPSRP